MIFKGFTVITVYKHFTNKQQTKMYEGRLLRHENVRELFIVSDDYCKQFLPFFHLISLDITEVINNVQMCAKLKLYEKQLNARAR